MNSDFLAPFYLKNRGGSQNSPKKHPLKYNLDDKHSYSRNIRP